MAKECRQEQVIKVLQALVDASVVSVREADVKVDELIDNDDTMTRVLIAGTEYRIAGMIQRMYIRPPQLYILQIEEVKGIEEGSIVNMTTIGEFKNWVKARLAAASASVDNQ